MQISVNNKDFSLYINHDEIQRSLLEMALKINDEYHGKTPLIIGVLNGAFMVVSDLVKKISIGCEVTFMRVSSYAGTESSGQMQQVLGLKENIAGRDLIIVEDIIDTGLTMQYLLEELKQQDPSSIKIATLLFKKEALQVDIKPDYVGFEIPRKFVLGYGLDYDGAGRNLPDIYAEKE